jgi:hypothetical protein
VNVATRSALGAVSLAALVLALVATRVVRFVRRLPSSTLIATDAPTVLYGTTERASIIVPSRTNALTGQRDHHFEARLHELVDVLRARHGVVVLFSGFNQLTGLAGADDLMAINGVSVRDRAADGGAILTVR